MVENAQGMSNDELANLLLSVRAASPAGDMEAKRLEQQVNLFIKMGFAICELAWSQDRATYRLDIVPAQMARKQ